MSAQADRIEGALPSALPKGERMLWQGGPEPARFARHALHVWKVAAYFAALLVWRVAMVWRDGGSWEQAFNAILTTVLLGAVVCMALWLYARWSASATTYTITSARVIIRSGVALPITVNIPFAKIDKVDLRKRDAGGDVILHMLQGARAGYVILWPNVQPFHFLRPRPMLRCLEQSEPVVAALTEGLKSETGNSVAPQTRGDVSAGAAVLT
ncbi:MAG: photosynthetic complex putative assembly protein PuhB [Pseudomonadota bacterium]